MNEIWKRRLKKIIHFIKHIPSWCHNYIRPYFAPISLSLFVLLLNHIKLFSYFVYLFSALCCLLYFKRENNFKEGNRIQIRHLFTTALLAIILYYFVLPLLLPYINLDYLISITFNYFKELDYKNLIKNITFICSATIITGIVVFYAKTLSYYSLKFVQKYINTLNVKKNHSIFIEHSILFFCFCFILFRFTPNKLYLSEVEKQALSFLLKYVLKPIACLVTFLFIFKFYAFIKQKKSNPTTNNLILSDTPIDNIDYDELGRKQFIEDILIKDIKSVRFEDSHVFGLYGQWGEGKSSVLNIVRNKFADDDDYLVLYFDPWYFNNEKALLENFYNHLEIIINENFYLKSFEKIKRKYLNKLAGEIKYLSLFANSNSAETVEELKKRINQKILHTGKKILILIDDVDRLSKEEVYSVFKLIRLNADLNKTRYLVALDNIIISKMLEENHTQDYLEKIIQSSYELPKIDEFYLKKFFFKNMKIFLANHNISNFYNEFMENIDELRLMSFFPTLRKIKKFLNSLSVYSIVAGEVNVVDFVLLEIIRVSHSRLYYDILNNRSDYIPVDRGDFGKFENGAFVGRITRKLIEMLKTHPRRQELNLIINRLFPELNNKLGVLNFDNEL